MPSGSPAQLDRARPIEGLPQPSLPPRWVATPWLGIRPSGSVRTLANEGGYWRRTCHET